MKNKLLILLLFISAVLVGQSNYPQNDFVAPVNFKMLLSGNFGELRGNHFHSGIDIKTNGEIGKKVYSIADGYICRIKVSPTGFGKAIYVCHENGYTSVYGHLDRFNEEINEWVKEQQYRKESFAVNLYPRVNQFPVEQSEVIAFSGNTGGSQGPHLHFEIRETKTEKPVNPLLFGFEIKDFTRPKIKGLKVYAIDKNSSVNGRNSDWEFKTEGWGMVHRLKRKQPIEVSGNIGFAVKTYDLLNESYNKNGVYSIELLIDSSLIYKSEIDRFAFPESRYINSYIDYAHYVDLKERYQRSIVDEGNKLSFLKEVYNNGVVNFDDDKIHTLIYEIKDAYGNTSRLTCKLKSKPSPVKAVENVDEEKENWFAYDEDNSIDNEEIKLKFKSGSFYKSFLFDLRIEDSADSLYSKLFQVHRKQVPVHRAYKMKLKTQGLPKELQSKALIVKFDDDNIPEAMGGSYFDGYIKANVKTLGTFAVMIDTIAPDIKALNIHNRKKINGYRKIKFKIKDNLSGIKSYRGSLNGQWILMEYDPKNELLTYYVDDRMNRGKNNFKLVVTDQQDNKSTFEAEVFF